MIVISDTSVITNLAAIGHLSLLSQLYQEVVIPAAVYRELVEVDAMVPGQTEVQTADWFQVQESTNLEIIERLRTSARLDPGESEAISLALELNADLLLIDERRGRAEADRLGIRITGLLGILVEAKRKSLVMAVKPLIDDLIKTSEFRVSSALYDYILNLVDEGADIE